MSGRAVVVALDPDVRDDWARALEACGFSVDRCIGPSGLCPVSDGRACPLTRGAAFALYHDAVLSDGFEDRLRAGQVCAMAIAARDRRRMDGDHEPVMSRVIASPRGAS